MARCSRLNKEDELPKSMSFARCVQEETLDHLPPADPRAARSRADLRRINRIMGSRSIMLRALQEAFVELPAPRKIIEFGCGDGSLMLRLARQLAPRWPCVELTLLDRQSAVESATLEQFSCLGWQAQVLAIDIEDWAAAIRQDPAPHAEYDLALANLFIHHFDHRQLQVLFASIAQCTKVFMACEPRRAWSALAASHLLAFIGANAVTRKDAALSVRAGFTGQEMSLHWPEAGAWRLREYEAGAFSHCFLAVSGQAGMKRNGSGE